MSTEIIRYKISPENAGVFLKAYTEAGQILRASSYCQGYELIHGEEEPENWILIIRWTSTADHLNGFRRAPEFSRFFQLVKPFFSEIQEMKHYVTTELHWSRAGK